MKNPMDEFPPCGTCGKNPNDCQCPICPVCGTIGNPLCLTEHGLKLDVGMARDDLLRRIEREFRRMRGNRLVYETRSSAQSMSIDGDYYTYSWRNDCGNSEVLFHTPTFGWELSVNFETIKPTEQFYIDKLRGIYANIVWILAHQEK